MQALTLLRVQAHANRMANHRLHAAMAVLSPADLHAPRTSFFPTLMASLNHVLAVSTAKAKAERTLTLEIDDEAFERVYGFASHPVPATRGRRLAVRVVSQFGDESTKVLDL